MIEITATSSAVWLRTVVISLIAASAFLSRLFSVIRFESIIHEFDPWFNFRSTKYLVDNNWYDFLNWFDERSWYPLGRVVGGTVYPGIMVTSASIHYLLNNMMNFTVSIKDICVFLAPMFSGLTAFATFLLTKEMKDSSAGLLAGAFIGVVPGYISRSVAGSYDNEGIAIFLLMITFYLWIKAVKLGSSVYSVFSALFYFYMVSAWGGYVFIINLIPLHVFVLLLMGRYTDKIYTAYSTFYVVGTLYSMTIPFVGFQPTRTSEHMAALGIFGLVQLFAFSKAIRTYITGPQFKVIIQGLIAVIFTIMFALLVLLTLGGYVAPWTGRFYSLWDTSYAKKYIPIIASVSEHQPTAWTSFFFDLHILLILYPAGIYHCFRLLRDEHIFVVLYAVTGSYFAGVMVRLMLTLTPIVCVSAAIALSFLLDTFAKDVEETGDSSSGSDKPGNTSEKAPSPKYEKSAKKFPSTKGMSFGIVNVDTKYAVFFTVFYLLCIFVYHCTWVTSNAYSSPSVILSTYDRNGNHHIIDDFREAYYWLRKNTKEDAKIMSWWDYGYQIAGFSNRTTLVDNNTWNNTHIATVGKAMATSEEVSYEVMRRLDVDYVLVIFGGVIGYSGDDINKFLWMIRIAQGVYPQEVKESEFFTRNGEYRVDEAATDTMKNSLMYKMSYYRYSEIFGGNPVDRVRQVQMPKTDPTLSVLEEAYSSTNYIVRIYKVKPLDNIGRNLKKSTDFEKQYDNYKIK